MLYILFFYSEGSRSGFFEHFKKKSNAKCEKSIRNDLKSISASIKISPSILFQPEKKAKEISQKNVLKNTRKKHFPITEDIIQLFTEFHISISSFYLNKIIC